MSYRLKNPIPLPLERLAPSPEDFAHRSLIHGQAHVARVIVHAFVLVDALGLEKFSTRVWAAAHIHDLGRRHDGLCFDHGRNALDRLPTFPHIQSLLAEGGVSEEDWEGISVAVDNHCRAEIPKAHPHWLLTAILKDADGLDRVRLGDLDPRYFRFPETRGLVPFAEALYEQTDANLRRGPDYFATLWPVAQRLLSEAVDTGHRGADIGSFQHGREETMDNRARLNLLFQNRDINLDRGRLFDYSPDPKPAAFDFDKVEGMLLGVAVGDALGITTEGTSAVDRRARHGELRDYIPNRYVNEARGFPSDDTQLTFWTLEQLIKDRGFVPENVARRIANGGRIFGIGRTVRGFLENLNAGKPWYESGPESAGNGALMRISPILIPHLRTGGSDLWVDTALAAMMTHNDRLSTSACLAFVAMLWELLDMKEAPDSHWWVEKYVELARDLEGETHCVPRGGQFSDYRGPLYRYVEEKLAWADKEGKSVLEACDAMYSGAFLLETTPAVLLVLTRYGHDPEEALVRAVNDTKDNDTIAAIVGAAVGALHGRKALPERWVANLSGRTTDSDDGRVFELIEQARAVFWMGAD